LVHTKEGCHVVKGDGRVDTTGEKCGVAARILKKKMGRCRVKRGRGREVFVRGKGGGGAHRGVDQ